MENIYYLDYHCSVSKWDVQKRLNTFIAQQDYTSGAKGLFTPIRWIEHTCRNRNEAIEYIKDHDRDWYDSLAVLYKLGRKKMWLVKIEYPTTWR